MWDDCSSHSLFSLSVFFIMPHLKCQHKKRILCCLHAFCLTLSPIHWLIQFSKINFFRNSSSWLQFPVAWNSFLPVLLFFFVMCRMPPSTLWFREIELHFFLHLFFLARRWVFSDHLTSPLCTMGGSLMGYVINFFFSFREKSKLDPLLADVEDERESASAQGMKLIWLKLTFLFVGALCVQDNDEIFVNQVKIRYGIFDVVRAKLWRSFSLSLTDDNSSLIRPKLTHLMHALLRLDTFLVSPRINWFHFYLRVDACRRLAAICMRQVPHKIAKKKGCCSQSVALARAQISRIDTF